MAVDYTLWKTFFNNFEEFKVKAEKQKARGLNDYSLLSSLLNVNDEVRLHSRFLYSMLNPDSKHYQGSLFLELFLHVIGRKGWLDVTKTRVSIEAKLADLEGKSGFIDIYLSDGEKHIVIENKLDAPDQEEQLKRYVKQVQAAHHAEAKDILFVYLSKGRAKPTLFSFGDYCLDEHQNYILDENKNRAAHYLSISFQQHIMTWVNNSLRETQNLTNLHFAFSEYRKIIEKLSHTYKSNVMGLNEFLRQQDNEENVHHYLTMANEIATQLPALKAEWCNQALTVDLIGHVQHGGIWFLESERYVSQKLTNKSLKAFFSNTNGGRDKILVFNNNTTPKKLLVVLATKFLYVGLTAIDNDDEWREIKHNSGEINTPKWISEIHTDFTGFKAWRVDAHEAAISLHDYHTSDVKKVVQSFLDNYSPKDTSHAN